MLLLRVVSFFALLTLCGALTSENLIGQWQTSTCRQPSHGRFSYRELHRFTAATHTFETIYYAPGGCVQGTRWFTIIKFGPYRIQGTLPLSLYYGTSTTRTTSVSVVSFGNARSTIIPNSQDGVTFLNNLMTTPISSCVTRSIGRFQIGFGTETTFSSCDDLGLTPFYICSTTYTIFHRDPVSNEVYVAAASSPCDASLINTATFNPSNCAVSSAGCVPGLPFTKNVLPELTGLWTSSCNGREKVDLMLTGAFWTSKATEYSDDACVNSITESFQYGPYQTGALLDSTVGKYALDVTITSNFAMSTAGSVQSVNDIIAADTRCRNEVRNFTNGEFKQLTFSTCPALGYQSLSDCPIRYSTVRVNPANIAQGRPVDTMLVGFPQTCAPSVPTGEIVFNRTSPMSSDISNFGVSLPINFVTGGAQTDYNIFFFSRGWDTAAMTGDYSSVDVLLSANFKITVRGDAETNPTAGTISNVAGKSRSYALATYDAIRAKAFNSTRSQFTIISANPFTCVASFTETITDQLTGTVYPNLANLVIFKMDNGLVADMTIYPDTLSYSAITCPGYPDCAAIETKTAETRLVGYWASVTCSPHSSIPNTWIKISRRFTRTTVLVEIMNFPDANCRAADLLWTEQRFGSYYRRGSSARSLYFGTSSTPTSTVDEYLWGFTKIVLVPNSATGLTVLSNIANTTCPSLSPFQQGIAKDATFDFCTDLALYPIFTCSTKHYIVHMESDTSMYIGSAGTEQEMCNVTSFNSAVFNRNNCVGGTPGCQQLWSATIRVETTQIEGVWKLPCTPQSDGTSIVRSITFSLTEYGSTTNIYNSTSCDDSNIVQSSYEFGKFQIKGAKIDGKQLMDFSSLSRFDVSRTDAQTAKLNSLISRNRNCRMRGFTTGEFTATTFITCAPLGIVSQATCPIRYTTVRVVSGNWTSPSTLYLGDETAGDVQCSPLGRSIPEISLTRIVSPSDTEDTLIFGTSIPSTFFKGEQQSRINAFFFLFGLRQSPNGNFDFARNLISDDFSILVHGSPAVVPYAGTFSIPAGGTSTDSLALYLAAKAKYVNAVATRFFNNVKFVAASEYAAVLTLEENITAVGAPPGTAPILTKNLYVMRYSNGLVFQLEIYPESAQYQLISKSFASSADPLSGKWDTSLCTTYTLPSLSVLYVQRSYIFTESSYSLQAMFFSSPKCEAASRLFTKHTFGFIYQKNASYPVSPRLYFGNNSSRDFTDTVSLYHLSVAKSQIIPDTPAGATYLNTRLKVSTQCEDKDALLPFSNGDARDTSFATCAELNILPYWNCTTIHAYVYFPDVSTMYLAKTQGQEGCSPTLTKIYFNKNNCVGGTAGCSQNSVAHTRQDSLDFSGVWATDCVAPGTLFGLTGVSSRYQITMSRNQYSLRRTLYNGGGCVTGSEALDELTYGKLQIGNILDPSTSPVRFGFDFAPLSHMIVPRTLAAADTIRKIASASPLCSQLEIDPTSLIPGEFIHITDAACPALGITPRAQCPIRYTSIRVSDDLSTAFIGANPTCDPATIFIENKWTRQSRLGLAPVFGASMPPFLFSEASSTDVTGFYFMNGWQEAMSSGNFSFMNSLVTSDFKIVFHGDASFISIAGTYTSTKANSPAEAIALFAAKRKTLQIVSDVSISFKASNEYTAMLKVTETIKGKFNGVTLKGVESMYTLSIRSGLVSSVEIDPDTLALASIECSSIASARCNNTDTPNLEGTGFELVGHWTSSVCAQTGSYFSKTLMRVTRSTLSIERRYFTTATCAEETQIFQVQQMASYSVVQTGRRSSLGPLYYGSGGAMTSTFDVLLVGVTNTAILPSSAAGANALTVLAQSNPQCADGAELLPFEPNLTTEVSSVTSCEALDIHANCPSAYYILNRANGNLYLGKSTTASICDISSVSSATFKSSNSVDGSDTAQTYQRFSYPQILGAWSNGCEYDKASNSSIALDFTFGMSYFARTYRAYQGAGCVKALQTFEGFAFGTYQLGDTTADGSRVLMQSSLSNQFMITDAATAKAINSIIQSNDVCLDQMGLFTVGEFKTVSYSSCPAFQLSSQAICPVYYTTIEIKSGRLGLSFAFSCSPVASAPKQSYLYRLPSPLGTEEIIDFGIGMPPFLFSPETQSRVLMDLFFTHLKRYVIKQGTISAIDGLLSPSFSVSVFSQNFQTFTTQANVTVSALAQYVDWRNSNFETSSIQDIAFSSSNSYKGTAAFSENIKSKSTSKVGNGLKSIAIFTFSSGLISKLELYPDQQGYDLVSCVGYVQCTSGQWSAGAPSSIIQQPIINTQNTNITTTTIYQYPASANPVETSRAIVGLLAFAFCVIVILLGVTMFLLLSLCRLQRRDHFDLDLATDLQGGNDNL